MKVACVSLHPTSITMKSVQVSAFLILIVSITLYRRGSGINKFSNHGKFPHGYYSAGDYGEDCVTLRNQADAPDAERFQFCEDATLWDVKDSNGKNVDRPLIASCDSGRKQWNTVMGPLKDPEPHGTLWLYVPPSDAFLRSRRDSFSSIPDELRGKPHRITFINYPANHDFHPLGVAVWPSQGGNTSNLYVVNHARQKSVIEHFTLHPHNPTQATHVRTITSLLFVAPNALALTSPNSFFMTNDHLLTRRLPFIGNHLAGIETQYRLPLGHLLHVRLNAVNQGTIPTFTHPTIQHISNTHFSRLLIPFANGVALSPSGNELAVASSSTGKVFIFDRDPSTNALKQKDKLQMPFAPDNLHYEASSNPEKATLIIAGHPDVINLVKVAAGHPGASAKSWVIAAVPGGRTNTTAATDDIRKSDRWTSETLFQSAGVEDIGGFGASTTGLVDSDTGTLYVPGLYSKGGVMMCRPNLPPKL
ncbi:hypothetical protein CPB83DRAFT_576542 [Crepidotus variabilis]|uniref:Uncharacterized protein n=1 Tax=Crepidotus variabilis TaxID=179855 RepID=A0A9P6E9K5_9AGAR|nr:hypothetical protein CPB83DRAFT_576542 [Crepidotus variabilis]